MQAKRGVPVALALRGLFTTELLQPPLFLPARAHARPPSRKVNVVITRITAYNLILSQHVWMNFYFLSVYHLSQE